MVKQAFPNGDNMKLKDWAGKTLPTLSAIIWKWLKRCRSAISSVLSGLNQKSSLWSRRDGSEDFDKVATLMSARWPAAVS